MVGDRVLPAASAGAIVAMYQLAVNKVLGKGSAAMTQLILRDATELFDEFLKEAGLELGGVGDIREDVKRVFKELGISEHVEVEVPEEAEASGSVYVIKVYDSIFKPVALHLKDLGIDFTLSPESFVAAYVVRKALRQGKNAKANIRIAVEPMKSPDDPLVIKITIR